MIMKTNRLLLLFTLALSFTLVACGKKSVDDSAELTDQEKSAIGTENDEGFSELPDYSQEGVEGAVAGAEEFEPIFFSYDQSGLTVEARETLRLYATRLKQAPTTNLEIEGHCDSRGTDEYNLALGQRRAQTVQSYLNSLGVSSARTSTISYGEERPAALGDSENAWNQNRRAEFKIQ